MVRFLFYCCSNLKEIYLPYWYQGINSCGFDMCGRLETVHYPDQLEEYAREITTARHFNDFSYCPRIQTFDLGSQTTKYKGKTYRVYKLSWNKVSNIDGYQVKRTINNSETSSFKPSVTSERYAWPKGKTVKVQIRTYKKSGSKKLYSDWRTISVKVK